MKYDNSLLEVWKWKEEVSKYYSALSIKEGFEKIQENTKRRMKYKIMDRNINTH
ncbi:MAG: hypothetical protein SVZ03_03530 [Spirochaetota bacterium]|nr:hypothetical protein [Spirochaetota bacterium]